MQIIIRINGCIDKSNPEYVKTKYYQITIKQLRKRENNIRSRK